MPCSKEAIERIQQLADENNLIIIPLVQTFGHFEVGTCFNLYVQIDQICSISPVLSPALSRATYRDHFAQGLFVFVCVSPALTLLVVILKW